MAVSERLQTYDTRYPVVKFHKKFIVRLDKRLQLLYVGNVQQNVMADRNPLYISQFQKKLLPKTKMSYLKNLGIDSEEIIEERMRFLKGLRSTKLEYFTHGYYTGLRVVWMLLSKAAENHDGPKWLSEILSCIDAERHRLEQ